MENKDGDMGWNQIVDILNITLGERKLTQVELCLPSLCLTPAYDNTYNPHNNTNASFTKGKTEAQEVNCLTCSGSWLLGCGAQLESRSDHYKSHVLPLNIMLLPGSENFTSQWTVTESFCLSLASCIVNNIWIRGASEGWDVCFGQTIASIQAGRGYISKVCEDLMTR